MKTRLTPFAHARRQRGLASLVVVMMLFFVVSLLAAYTNRNLIFEQKTSGNQYRSTQALEAAEAGLNWALSLLNGGTLDTTCTASTAPAALNFQQRYLSIATDGKVTNAVRASTDWPTCIYDDTVTPGTWLTHCACPGAGTLSPTAPPTSTGNQPAFRVWLAPGGPTATPFTPFGETIGSKPSMMVVQSVGCTRMPAPGPGCLDYVPVPSFGDGVATVQQIVALRTAIAVPPETAITARGTVTPAGGVAKLRVVNSASTTAGYTVHTGDLTLGTTQMQLESLPGTPGSSTVARDALLTGIVPASAAPVGAPLSAGERMFVKVFGMRKSVYREQPGLRVCPINCTAAVLQALINANPNRIIWVNGPLTLDAPIGSVAAPAMLIIDGPLLTLQAGAATTSTQASITGFVYLTGNTGAAPFSGPATIDLPDVPTSIDGALVVEEDLLTTYSAGSATAPGNQLTVQFNANVVNLLRWTYGSWVRTAGGWRDFSMQ